MKTIGVRVALAVATAVLGAGALAGCDRGTILVSVDNGCGVEARVLVSDSSHHADHVIKDFRSVHADDTAVFVVPVGPNDDVSLMTWDTATAKQVTRIASLQKEAVDGVADDGKALRILTLTGADCPAAG